MSDRNRTLIKADRTRIIWDALYWHLPFTITFDLFAYRCEVSLWVTFPPSLTQSLMLPSGCSPSLTHSINHWNSLTNVTLRMLLSTHLSVGPVDPLGALVLMWQKFTSQNFNIRVANEARKTFNNSITDKIVAQVNITFCLSNYKQTLWAEPALQVTLVTLNLLPIRMYVHSMW